MSVIPASSFFRFLLSPLTSSPSLFLKNLSIFPLLSSSFDFVGLFFWLYPSGSAILIYLPPHFFWCSSPLLISSHYTYTSHLFPMAPCSSLSWVVRNREVSSCKGHRTTTHVVDNYQPRRWNYGILIYSSQWYYWSPSSSSWNPNINENGFK